MTISVSSSDELIRLDAFLSSRLIQFSRSKIQKLIVDGRITVNDSIVKKNLKLSYGDIIKVDTESFKFFFAVLLLTVILPFKISFWILLLENWINLEDKKLSNLINSSDDETDILIILFIYNYRAIQ